MRSRRAWVISVLVVVLMVIALMRFNMTAMHEPGPAETRLANFPKRYFIYRARVERFVEAVGLKEFDYGAPVGLIENSSYAVSSQCGLVH